MSGDGAGIVTQAGGLLLIEALRVTGLDQGLSRALSRCRASRAVHDPGKIVTDLAVTPALDGDCLADMAVLRSSAAVRAGRDRCPAPPAERCPERSPDALSTARLVSG
ncbi:transposase family protein [Mycobacterium tuberculosis]|nr:transposase family protein [Mycobacterium tuberculosis]